MHPSVVECAIIGAADSLKGTVPVALLVVPPGTKESDAEIAEEVISLIRESVGAVASVKSAAVVKALPKTRSGKILRGVMKRVCDGADYVSLERSESINPDLKETRN